MPKRSNLRIALFLIRFGLGIFLIYLALDKILNPETSLENLNSFYLMHISNSMLILMGALELVLGLLFIIGTFKTWTYGAAILLHALHTFFAYNKFLTPLEQKHCFIAALPILFAFTALFLVRELDTKFNLTKKRSIFS